MKTTLYILILILLASCSDKKTITEKTIFYYLINSDGKNNGDTVKYEEFNFIGAGDEQVAKGYFSYNKKEHSIKVYTSDNQAPIDGGRLYYTLDSIGTIYSRSTTWWTSLRLQSNNDSINDLINAAYAHILMKPSLHCYQCRQVDRTDVKFLPPVIKEE